MFSCLCPGLLMGSRRCLYMHVETPQKSGSEASGEPSPMHFIAYFGAHGRFSFANTSGLNVDCNKPMTVLPYIPPMILASTRQCLACSHTVPHYCWSRGKLASIQSTSVPLFLNRSMHHREKKDVEAEANAAYFLHYYVQKPWCFGHGRPVGSLL